jgi:hypothetical protein
MSKSGNFGFSYWKNYHSHIGLSFKTSKYFGNMNKFYEIVSFGLSDILLNVYKSNNLGNDTITKRTPEFRYFVWEYSLFVEFSCGYRFNENWSIFTSLKINYDIVNFFYIKNCWTNYMLNAMVGIKYRF